MQLKSNLLLRILILNISCVLGVIVVSAQRKDGPQNSILWEIKHPETGHRSYVYALPEFFSDEIPKGVQDAFSTSVELLMVHPVDTEQRFQETKDKLLGSKPLFEIIKKLPEKERTHLVQKLGIYGIESSNFHKPILEVLNKLTHIIAKESEENWMIEERNFSKLAKARGIKLNYLDSSLENIQEDRENEAFQSVQNILKQPGNFQGALAKIKSIRKIGGIPSEELISNLCKNFPIFTRINTKINLMDSKKWVESFKDKTVFVAIPERLVLGKSGVISEMRKRGLLTRPLLVN